MTELESSQDEMSVVEEINRILKLSMLVDEVEKRQELDQKILDDPIVEM